MTTSRIILFLLLIGFGSCDFTSPDVLSPSPQSIPTIDLFLSEENYTVLLENKTTDVAVPAVLHYQDKEFKGTIEAQGAGSRYQPKWSFRIECEDGQTIEGLSDFNLSAQVYDKSMVRTAVASSVYRAKGFHVFNSTHAFLRINNRTRGLYLLTERVDEEFFQRRNLAVAELIKVMYGAKFSMESQPTITEGFEKRIPQDENLNNLSEFLHALDTVEPGVVISELSKYINVRQYLRYHALTTIIVNNDAFSNNFYFYKPAHSFPYTIIPWDFDNSFSPVANVAFYGENEIIQKLLQNSECFTLYKNELTEALNTTFTESNLFPVTDSVATAIGDAYALDPYLGQRGFALSAEVQKLKSFITLRRTYLLSNLSTFTR